MKEIRSAALRYGLALGAFVSIVALSFGVERLFSIKLQLTFLLIATMIACAWYLGRGPGLLIAVALELTLESNQPTGTDDQSGQPPNLIGLRVLLVDDEPDTLEIVSVMLKQYGAQVRVTASTAAALEALSEWTPDVLISDLGMPGEDGFALIGQVRTLAPEQGGNIPAAALTAYVSEDDSLRALAAGYHTHIAKPVEPITLAAAVADLAKRGARLSDLTKSLDTTLDFPPGKR